MEYCLAIKSNEWLLLEMVWITLKGIMTKGKKKPDPKGYMLWFNLSGILEMTEL
jgi:hypothetical protein